MLVTILNSAGSVVWNSHDLPIVGRVAWDFAATPQSRQKTIDNFARAVLGIPAEFFGSYRDLEGAPTLVSVCYRTLTAVCRCDIRLVVCKTWTIHRGFQSLSPREWDICQAMHAIHDRDGLSTAVGCTLSTLETHQRNIRNKLRATNHRHLASIIAQHACLWNGDRYADLISTQL